MSGQLGGVKHALSINLAKKFIVDHRSVTKIEAFRVRWGTLVDFASKHGSDSSTSILIYKKKEIILIESHDDLFLQGFSFLISFYNISEIENIENAGDFNCFIT